MLKPIRKSDCRTAFISEKCVSSEAVTHARLDVSLIGAITAMIMELIPIPLDDNFKIPLGSGAIMMMLYTPI